MGRYSPSKSYNHSYHYIWNSWGIYEISWTVDRYYPNSRLRWPTEYRRHTDRQGAQRFCKKWGLEFEAPEEISKRIKEEKESGEKRVNCPRCNANFTITRSSLGSWCCPSCGLMDIHFTESKAVNEPFTGKSEKAEN